MFSRLLLILLPAALVGAAPPFTIQAFTTQSPDLNPNDSAKVLAADPAGNLFVVSSAPRTSAITNIHVTKTDPHGAVLASFDFGGTGIDTPTAAATDPQGNLIVVGGTQSKDFPLVSPLNKNGVGFATKIDAQLHQILFSTRLGNTGGGSTLASATAVAVDPAGNIYITGLTNAGFPTTPGVFQPQAPVLSQAGNLTHGFITELAPAGDRAIFSTYFSGSDFVCANGQSPCFIFQPIANFSPPVIATTPSAIAIDSAGSIIIAGTSNSSGLPVSAQAYATKCGCTNLNSAAFIASLSPGATRLNWGTYIPATPPVPVYAPSIVGVPLDTITSLAVDAAGNVVFAGAAVPQFPVAAGALQAAFPSAAGNTYAGYAAKLDATGSKLLFSTWIGGTTFSSSLNGPAGLALDNSGTIWITGTAASGTLPVSAGTPLLGTDYILRLAGDGGSVVSAFTVPHGGAGASIQTTPAGAVDVLGTSGTLLISSAAAGPSLLGIAEAVSSATANAVAPRELISLFGLGIGPFTPQNESISGGVIANSLAGVQVLFDGVPAALLYAGPTQINAIVPAATAGRETTTISIVTPSGTLAGPTLPVETALPAVFTNPNGFALAVNQDGTMNSEKNPAKAGSVVSIWMIGAGAATYTPDNIINPIALTGNVNPISILAPNLQFPGVSSLEVTYAGDAPGAPSGVTQVNFVLPPWGKLNYQVQIGAATASFLIFGPF
jgi:uncharacterized protein (TIGR03437 family)